MAGFYDPITGVYTEVDEATGMPIEQAPAGARPADAYETAPAPVPEPAAAPATYPGQPAGSTPPVNYEAQPGGVPVDPSYNYTPTMVSEPAPAPVSPSNSGDPYAYGAAWGTPSGQSIGMGGPQSQSTFGSVPPPARDIGPLRPINSGTVQGQVAGGRVGTPYRSPIIVDDLPRNNTGGQGTLSVPTWNPGNALAGGIANAMFPQSTTPNPERGREIQNAPMQTSTGDYRTIQSAQNPIVTGTPAFSRASGAKDASDDQAQYEQAVYGKGEGLGALKDSWWSAATSEGKTGAPQVEQGSVGADLYRRAGDLFGPWIGGPGARIRDWAIPSTPGSTMQNQPVWDPVQGAWVSSPTSVEAARVRGNAQTLPPSFVRTAEQNAASDTTHTPVPPAIPAPPPSTSSLGLPPAENPLIRSARDYDTWLDNQTRYPNQFPPQVGQTASPIPTPPPSTSTTNNDPILGKVEQGAWGLENWFNSKGATELTAPAAVNRDLPAKVAGTASELIMGPPTNAANTPLAGPRWAPVGTSPTQGLSGPPVTFVDERNIPGGVPENLQSVWNQSLDPNRPEAQQDRASVWNSILSMASGQGLPGAQPAYSAPDYGANMLDRVVGPDTRQGGRPQTAPVAPPPESTMTLPTPDQIGGWLGDRLADAEATNVTLPVGEGDLDDKVTQKKKEIAEKGITFVDEKAPPPFIQSIGDLFQAGRGSGTDASGRDTRFGDATSDDLWGSGVRPLIPATVPTPDQGKPGVPDVHFTEDQRGPIRDAGLSPDNATMTDDGIVVFTDGKGGGIGVLDENGVPKALDGQELKDELARIRTARASAGGAAPGATGTTPVSSPTDQPAQSVAPMARGDTAQGGQPTGGNFVVPAASQPTGGAPSYPSGSGSTRGSYPRSSSGSGTYRGSSRSRTKSKKKGFGNGMFEEGFPFSRQNTPMREMILAKIAASMNKNKGEKKKGK